MVIHQLIDVHNIKYIEYTIDIRVDTPTKTK